MKRRQVLGIAGGAIAIGVAGCVGGSDDEGTESTDGPIAHQDDYPDGVEEGEVNGRDDHGYETYSVNGHDIPLVPIDDVKEWYDEGTAVVADARPVEQYERLHIDGAVSSPVLSGFDADDPLADLSLETRIVTYCVCPHTMAGQRGATLQEHGYTRVYALDEGLIEWVERGYPVAGDDV